MTITAVGLFVNNQSNKMEHLTTNSELALFWVAPPGSGNVIHLSVVDGRVQAECENGIFDILPDGSHVGVLTTPTDSI